MKEFKYKHHGIYAAVLIACSIATIPVFLSVMKTINNWFSAIYVTTCIMTSLCIADSVLLSYILKDTTATKKSMAPGLEITLFVIAAALLIEIIWWNVGLAVKGFMAFCIVGCICWILALHDYIEIPPDIDPDTMEPVKPLR